MKIYLICFLFLIFASVNQIFGLGLIKETKNYYLYRLTEEIYTTQKPKLNDDILISDAKQLIQKRESIRLMNFLVLDFQKKRFQIKQFTLQYDLGEYKLVSQGFFKIIGNQIELIDKNNSIVSKGTINANKIVLTTGIRYFLSKEFKFVADLTRSDEDSKFWYWNEKYLRTKYKQKKVSKVELGVYSDGNNLKIILQNNEYSIYNQTKYIIQDISKGTWVLENGIIQLSDSDKINRYEFILIDSNKLVPKNKLPFSHEISIFKLDK